MQRFYLVQDKINNQYGKRTIQKAAVKYMDIITHSFVYKYTLKYSLHLVNHYLRSFDKVIVIELLDIS